MGVFDLKSVKLTEMTGCSNPGVEIKTPKLDLKSGVLIKMNATL